MMDMIVDRTLDNGLRLLALRHGVTPLTEARLIIPRPSRSRLDLAESTLLAACLSQRQEREDSVELSVAADAHQLSITASCCVDDTDALLSVLAEVVHGAPDGEESARAQLITQLRVTRAHPDFMVRAELAHLLFGDHPVSFQPQEDEVRQIVKAGRRPFDPRGALLVILSPGEAEPLADASAKALSIWRPDGLSAPPLPAVPRIEPGRLTLLPTPGAPQSRIRLRAQAVGLADERYPALFLASNVLGGSLSSRLSRALREDKGYVYSVVSFFDARPGSGLLAVEADTAADTTSAAIQVLGDELHRMQTYPPTSEEIATVRTHALGSMATRLAPRASFATVLADLASKAVDPLLLLDFPRRLTAVTPEQVVEAAERFCAPERFSGVVAADPDAITGPLSLVEPG